MKTYVRQTLACCDEGKRYIRLDYSGSLFYGAEYEHRETFLQIVHDIPPDWSMLVHADKEPDASPAAHDCNERVALHERCPFCSTDLSELKLKTRPPKNIMVVIDGGYYCATCEERLNACECAPPDRLWEAVRS